MSALSILPGRRVCLSCIRRSIGDNVTPIIGPSRLQVRGKKKTAKKDGTINVRLLVDMKGYGRKGAITPVAPGRMRNSWYPRQHAEYLSTVSDIDPKSAIAERDFTYGMQGPEQTSRSKFASHLNTPFPYAKGRTKSLDPQIATALLSDLLPSHLVFYRTAIVESEPLTEVSQTQSRRAASQAAQETYAAPESKNVTDEEPPSAPKLRHIFGSVSTLDIANSIKDILKKNSEEGRRAVLGAEDIRISADLSQGVEGAGGDRLKALGDFEIEVRVKAGDVVRRMVSIRETETTAP